MFKQHSIRIVALAAAGILGAVGCQSTGTETLASEEQKKVGSDSVRVAAEPERPAPVVRFEAVYFELDGWELSKAARQELKTSAKQMQAEPESGVVTIEGHCDERGSEEYNVALGERRAAAVKRYLVDLGVPASRLRVVTYGESRPAVRGESERAWRLNRRSEMRIGMRQASR